MLSWILQDIIFSSFCIWVFLALLNGCIYPILVLLGSHTSGRSKQTGPIFCNLVYLFIEANDPCISLNITCMNNTRQSISMLCMNNAPQKKIKHVGLITYSLKRGAFYLSSVILNFEIYFMIFIFFFKKRRAIFLSSFDMIYVNIF